MTPTEYSKAVAAEVRAALGRQRKTQAELAQALSISAPTAARRLDGTVPFNVIELMAIALWLDVDVASLTHRRDMSAA